MPYDERPDALPLDVQECRTALWRTRGNVTEAAKLLKISSNRLRNFVKRSEYLTEQVNESREMLVDIAEDIAYEALTDRDDPGRRDTMARFLMTGVGKNRGHGSGGGGVSINLPKGPINISWGDGSAITDNSKQIDGSVNR